jgi:hypothetical protein
MWIVIFLLVLAVLAGVGLLLGTRHRHVHGDPDLGRRPGDRP